MLGKRSWLLLLVLAVALVARPDDACAAAEPDYVEERRAAVKVVGSGSKEAAFEACRKLQTVAKTPLQRADAAELAAQCAMRLGRSDEALAIVQKIELEQYRKLNEMRILTATQKTAEIVKRFGDDDLLKYPDAILADVAFYRGYAWLFAKDGAKAAQDLELGETYATDQNLRGEICLNLGQAYRRLVKDDAKAIAAYRRTHETNNEFKQSTAAIAVSTILVEQGKIAEAKAELERVDEAKMTIPVYRDALTKAKAAVAAAKQP